VIPLKPPVCIKVTRDVDAIDLIGLDIVTPEGIGISPEVEFPRRRTSAGEDLRPTAES
jgi:hypothetical protein